MSKSSDSHIKVVCRLRPLNELEKNQGGQCCVTYTQNTMKLKVIEKPFINFVTFPKVLAEENPYDFSFDRIFGPETSQREVFQYSAKNVIESVMQGYNGTIFAYGQTSSGKTFTMEGPSLENEELKGIIPRMMDTVFEYIINANENLEFTVKISFLEIYNEKIQDLLDPRKSNLHIKEDKNKGIFVQDATEVYVNSVENMKKVMKMGAENRTIAATRMNERSSRSHSIFILSILQKEINFETSKQSRLYFVDLAGSEKIAKTHVTGQQLEEAKNINKSLSALGNVINALTSSKIEHVPYRDSKLTRILQESIGGNSKTTLIIACSMCSYNDKETLSTFRFGARAKSIRNKPIVNIERSAKELKAILEAAEIKIKHQEELISKLQMQIETNTNWETTNSLDSSQISRIEDLDLLEKLEKIDNLNNNSNASKVDLSQTLTKQRQTSKISATLTILKQHIQLGSLNEELKNLRSDKFLLEEELNSKNKEIYELNERIMIQEENYGTLIPKYANHVHRLQVNVEKMAHENQILFTSVGQIRRELLWLRSELNCLLLNNGFFANGKKQNENEETEYKIMQIIKMIGDVEKFIEKFQGSQANVRILHQEIEENYKISNKLHTEETSLKTSQSDDILHCKSENLSAQISKRSTNQKKNRYEEKNYLSSEPDEEAKIQEKQPDEKSIFYYFKSKKESEKSFEESVRKMNEIEEPELKVESLQELVASQRKTIDNLFKVNHDLCQQIDMNNSSIDQRIMKYKTEMQDLKKIATSRVAEFESNIEEYQRLLNEKAIEIKEYKSKYEKEISQRKNQLTEMKVSFDKLQKIVNNNNNMKKIFELEQKLRELGGERQKLFNDLHTLRLEADKKEDHLSEKNCEINVLQSKINSLASQLDTLKYINNSLMLAQTKEVSQEKKANNQPRRQSPIVNILDKNIIKPIKGGGGNLENFNKKNFLAHESLESFSNFETKESRKDLCFPEEMFKIRKKNDEEKPVVKMSDEKKTPGKLIANIKNFFY